MLFPFRVHTHSQSSSLPRSSRWWEHASTLSLFFPHRIHAFFASCVFELHRVSGKIHILFQLLFVVFFFFELKFASISGYEMMYDAVFPWLNFSCRIEQRAGTVIGEAHISALILHIMLGYAVWRFCRHSTSTLARSTLDENTIITTEAFKRWTCVRIDLTRRKIWTKMTDKKLNARCVIHATQCDGISTNKWKLNYKQLTLIRQSAISSCIFCSSGLQTIRWRTWKSMGMRLMAGVHFHGDIGNGSPDWSHRTDIGLGNCLSWRFRMAGKSKNPIQPASGADGGRFHHVIGIL